MAHDGSQKNSSRKGSTTRRGARKPSRRPPRFGRYGQLAHFHHLLPLRAVELEAAPEKKNSTGR